MNVGGGSSWLRRMHAAEAAGARQAARQKAGGAYAEAERAARTGWVMGGFFSELSALDGFADRWRFADSDTTTRRRRGDGRGAAGPGPSVRCGRRRLPGAFCGGARRARRRAAAAAAARPRRVRRPRGGPRRRRRRNARPARPPPRPPRGSARRRRRPKLRQRTYGKGLGAYAAREAAPGGQRSRSRKELGVVAAARSARRRRRRPLGCRRDVEL